MAFGNCVSDGVVPVNNGSRERSFGLTIVKCRALYSSCQLKAQSDHKIHYSLLLKEAYTHQKCVMFVFVQHGNTGP